MVQVYEAGGGNSNSASPLPPSGKMSFMTIWKDVLLSPSVANFARYRPLADLGTAVKWVLAGLVIESLISAPIYFLNQNQAMQWVKQSSPDLGQIMAQQGASLGSALCAIPFTLVLGLVFVFLHVGLLYVVAKLFQGEGTFTETFYLVQASMVPLGIAATVLSLLGSLFGQIPFLGVVLGAVFGLVSLAVAVYGLALQAMAVAAAHEFSLGKGVAVVLIPAVIVVFLCCCVVGMTAMILASVASSLPNYSPY
jgi:hypothetical protein